MNVASTPTQTSPLTSQTVSPSEVQELSRDEVGQAFKNVLLKKQVERIIAKNEKNGVLTDVSIMDMQTKNTIVGHNLDTEQFAASVNKVPVAHLILTEIRKGNISLDQQVSWAASDRRDGAGVYDDPSAPTQASVRDVLYDLLNRSGNTAVRILVNKLLGGSSVVNTRINQELGLKHTYLIPVDSDRFYLGNTTARDSLTALTQLLSKNDGSGKFVRNALVTNIYADYGVRSQLAGNDYIVLANKIGILDDPEGNNRHDVGIIYNTKTHRSFGYSFVTTAPGETWETPTAQAGVSLADMGSSVLRAAGDKTPKEKLAPKSLAAPRSESKTIY